MEPERHYLSSLFEPKSIAIIGASAQTSSVGFRITQNLIDSTYRGKLYLVSQTEKTLFAQTSFPTIGNVPPRIDLAIVCTPTAHISRSIDECGKAGVRNVLIATGSYAEAGKHLVALQKSVHKKARRYRMRILGPGSLGFIRPSVQVNASYTDMPAAKPGSVALISQSGGLFSAAIDWGSEHRIDCSLLVSMGAECDIDFGEVLDYLVSDPCTESIFLYIEHIKNARRFMSALRAAARCKPVLLVKIGRNATVARTKLAHLPNEIGQDDVFDAALRRAGVVRLATVNQMYAAIQALFAHFRPRGNRLAIIANGSGPGILALDRATDLQIPLAQLTSETRAKLKRILPAHATPANPLDIFSTADPQRFADALSACLQDANVDGVMVVLSPHASIDPLQAAELIIQVEANTGKPVLTCWMGGLRVKDAVKRLRQAGIPAFRTPEPAVDMFSHISNYYRAQQLLLQAPASISGEQAPHIESARLVIDAALLEGRTHLSALEAKAVLAAFHIPIAHTVIAHSASEAVTLAKEIGLPVVMKITSPQIRRKTDCGGVRLGLADPDAVRGAYGAIIKEVRRCRPDARIEGVSIEPMVRKVHARELMIGTFRDKVFGPAISFGLGGAEGEVAGKQRSVALPPLNPTLIADMLHATSASVHLGEFRHMPAVNVQALQTVLLRISEMICELPAIQTLNINPLIIDEHGAIAVDVSIGIDNPPPADGPYDHMAIHPYPAHLSSQFITADGEVVSLRPIRPEDAAMEQEFLQRLSPESRYLRFMNTIRELSPLQLARLTQIDYDREMAFVALLAEQTPTVEIGVARYVTNPDGESCEFAIVVADDWHGKGLARHMMNTLIATAQSRGLRYMTGDFLTQNIRMIRFVQSLGFVISMHPDDATLRRGVLDLAL